MRLSALFEHVPVPWKIQGIGGREVEDSVDLFSTTLEAATLEEAIERGEHMFEAIRGKRIEVPNLHVYNIDGDERSYLYDDGPYAVIPNEISNTHYPNRNGHESWCHFNIICKIPRDSPLFGRISIAWINAPSICITGREP